MHRAAAIAVVLLYLVVVAGAVVRASGSGMGCPDWPKCFGRLIPPTDVSQIPPEFIEEFRTKGHGNLLHTWIEFVNRGLGSISGLAIAATILLAWKEKKLKLRATRILMIAFVVFGFVVWMGKVVVDTDLKPVMVTVHMLGGLFVVCAAILAYVASGPGPPAPLTKSLRTHLVVAVALVLVQTLLGTQVRESVDRLQPGECCDGRLEEHLGWWLYGHRLNAFLVVFAVGLLYFRLRAQGAHVSSPWLTRATAVLLGLEYLAGVLLVRLNLPAFLQPVHLVLAALLLGVLLALHAGSRNAESADGELKIGPDTAKLPAP